MTGNRGNGIVVAGDVNSLVGVTASGNGGHGIDVRGSSVRISHGTVRSNGGAGVATARGTRGVSIDVTASANGGLGIDREDDGVTPNDGTEADGIMDAPQLLSARWDEASRKTILRVRTTSSVPAKLPEPQAWSHRSVFLRYFTSNAPDPSGFGEGEELTQRLGWHETLENGEMVIDVDADLRGKWITATRLMTLCYWEFGCGGADSSEFSNALRVE